MRIGTVALLASLTVVAAGCASTSTAGTSETEPAAQLSFEALNGTWDMNSVMLSGAEPVDTAGVTMEVDADGGFRILDECNNPSGRFSLDDGVLGVEEGLMMTRMACPGAVGERENQIVAVFSDVSGATLTEAGALQVVGTAGVADFQRSR